MRQMAKVALLVLALTGCASSHEPDPIVEAPQYLTQLKPSYPKASLRAGEEGRCVLRFLVLRDGTVGEVRLRQSSGHPRLDAAAIESIGKASFIPAKTRGGRSAEAWVEVPLNFKLE